jgi:hypothetical protein
MYHKHISMDLYQDKQRTRDTNIYLGNPQGEKTQKNLSLIMHDPQTQGTTKIQVTLRSPSLMNELTTIQCYQQDQMKNPFPLPNAFTSTNAHSYYTNVFHMIKIKSLTNNQGRSTFRNPR